MKICNKCKKQKEEKEFSKNKVKQDGLNSKCKECIKEYNEVSRSISRLAHVKRRYKLSNKQYTNLLDEQNGLCKICLTKLEMVCVDHNHTTKEVRGLLCNRCNIGLGNFKDNVKILAAAIDYLKRF